MGCLSNYTLKGLAVDCAPVLPGIEEVWIGYHGDYAVTINESAHSVSTITASNSAKMEHYCFERQSGSLTSTMSKNSQMNVSYFTNTIALQFSKLEGVKHMEIEALSRERLAVIVHTSDNKFFFVGAAGDDTNAYVTGTDATAQTGQSMDDFNGYNVTLEQVSGHLPYEMTAAQVQSVTNSGTIVA